MRQDRFHDAVLGMFALRSPAGAQDGVLKAESLEDYHARMEWFAEAKYGIFIHFGLYSQLGGEWKGEPVPWYAEWLQASKQVPREEYATIIKEFNPEKFDADFIVLTAKQAGRWLSAQINPE